MAHSPQEIFRIIMLHNHLLTEEDVDGLLAQTPDPEDVIAKLVFSEMITEQIADKVMSLYKRNLEKAGLTSEGVAAAAAVTMARAAPPVSHPTPPPAPRHPTPPPAPAARHPTPTPAPAARHPTPPPAPAHATPAHATPEPTEPAPTTPAPAAPAPVPATTPYGEPIELGAGGRDLIFRLLKAARDGKASDLHIKAGAIPIVRIATVLRELNCPAIPPEMCESALLEVLDETHRNIFLEKRDLDFSLDSPEIGRFRGNYLREHRGMAGIFRLIAGKVPTFEELKLPEQIRRLTTYRQGVVLITGPKGSGKTTTLAALIDLINSSRQEHIITIEDPIEFVHPSKKGHVNQREVGPHTNSFSNALRAALREAPDVIMVGEMRDLETIGLAITAAETGHLVFGTLHTPDAARTIGRVLDVFPAEEQAQIRTMFSESLRGIVCQHLIPGVDGQSMHLAVEIMFNTGAIGNLIRENRAFQLKGMMQTGKKIGMQLMDDSLLQLVREQKIAKSEALARSDNYAQMERDLAAIH